MAGLGDWLAPACSELSTLEVDVESVQSLYSHAAVHHLASLQSQQLLLEFLHQIFEGGSRFDLKILFIIFQ